MEPELPVTVEIATNPLGAFNGLSGFITPDIDMDHIRPKANGGEWSAKQIGGFAWSIYGLLIFGNVTFYGDLIYRQYVVDKHDRLALVAMTMFNGVNFFRILTHYIMWLLAGFFWCATFLSTPNVFIFFSWVTYILVIWEFARMFLTIFATCISFLVDYYEYFD